MGGIDKPVQYQIGRCGTATPQHDKRYRLLVRVFPNSAGLGRLPHSG